MTGSETRRNIPAERLRERLLNIEKRLNERGEYGATDCIPILEAALRAEAAHEPEGTQPVAVDAERFSAAHSTGLSVEDATAECAGCQHPFSEHTGRSLYEGRLVPEQAVLGNGCEHRLDFHHTCGCGRFRLPTPEPGPDARQEGEDFAALHEAWSKHMADGIHYCHLCAQPEGEPR